MHLAQKIDQHRERVSAATPIRASGRLKRVVGMALEAVGCDVPVGGRCLIECDSGDPLEAEVVGFDGDRVLLMPLGTLRGVTPGSAVIPQVRDYRAPVGTGLLGRVIDGTARPLDQLGPLQFERTVPLASNPINPLDRQPIQEPLDVGIRSINAMLTVGKGQRLGLFAGSGVGKSVLLGMMTRFTEADVIVVGLIGERGREVKEFVQETLGPEGLRRAVIVAAPADTSPVNRLHGAWLATAIAGQFRDEGHNVLLLMDSLTRFAQAQREISLAIGEPPATRGYTPSVFARMSELVERAGNSSGPGSLTAFYTVLAEGDDQNDPVADSARAILDGHIVLSRSIAEANIYPAIDLDASISRAMHAIVSPQHLQASRVLARHNATYMQNRDLIQVGAYQAGSDARIDAAIALRPHIEQFMQQGMNQNTSFESSLRDLYSLTHESGQG